MNELPETLFSTATGNRKHLRQCPHLLEKEVVEVTADDPRPVCDGCDKELNGHGRTYHADLDAAFASYQQPVETRALVKQFLAGVDWDEIWTPYSNSYIALGRAGRGVAWIHKTYVEPALGQVAELPGHALTASGTRSEDRSGVWGETCPSTYLKHPTSGRCDDCQQQSA